MKPVISPGIVGSIVTHATFAGALYFSLQAQSVLKLPKGEGLLQYEQVSVIHSRPASTALGPAQKTSIMHYPNVETDVNLKPAEPTPSPLSEAPNENPVIGALGTVEGKSKSALGVDNGSKFASIESEYALRILQEIERQKKYPVRARDLSHQGIVHVHFVIDALGKVEMAELHKPCTFESLNRAAVKLVANLDSLPPFPDSLKKDKLRLILPIQYRLQ